MANPIKSIFERAQQLVTRGLARPPQDYLYLDRPSLNEHYQGITGTARVPGITSETLSASIGGRIPIINWGVGGSLETSFSLSDYHLFESLGPAAWPTSSTACAASPGFPAACRGAAR
jgi:hypothetical protein